MTIKRGDRVRVYGNTDRVHSDAQNGIPTAFRRGDKGTVDYSDGGEAGVDLDKGGFVGVHVKQLRKLKVKPLREIYVIEVQGTLSVIHHESTESLSETCKVIKFREVKV